MRKKKEEQIKEAAPQKKRGRPKKTIEEAKVPASKSSKNVAAKETKNIVQKKTPRATTLSKKADGLKTKEKGAKEDHIVKKINKSVQKTNTVTPKAAKKTAKKEMAKPDKPPVKTDKAPKITETPQKSTIKKGMFKEGTIVLNPYTAMKYIVETETDKTVFVKEETGGTIEMAKSDLTIVDKTGLKRKK